ncbi:ribosomal protein L4 [Trichodelitschia bisporula]|uniref:Large ribosomal subunit protein uL4m n=1 Tax=Trichodelitschia bisporula TaxID=703511 RepID=A0A6G1HPY2_9PEZI|nr:ribosomal protein L4 [Trichodelitschia bisporula]
MARLKTPARVWDSVTLCLRNAGARPVSLSARALTTTATSTTTPPATVPQRIPRPPLASRIPTAPGLRVPRVAAHLAPSPALTTLYAFPALEPLRFLTYPASHLRVPLRRDILHRAVIYEGDATRQGTASTKWRGDVHGSNRKIRPQKGTGRARLGDKKSPMLRGGGVAFGPKPRDFATGLNRKIYDLAWRTALSYRWRRGELVVVDSLEMETVEEKEVREAYVRKVLGRIGLGHEGGRSMFVTMERRDTLFDVLGGKEKGRHGRKGGRDGRAVTVKDVDVKNLLQMKRVVVEEKALNWLLRRHQSDVQVPRRLVRRKAAGVQEAVQQVVDEAVDGAIEAVDETADEVVDAENIMGTTDAPTKA